MGVNLRELFVRKELGWEELRGKTLVLDGNNMLYQFLATIRARDGTLLTNKEGRVTSHLIGLFSRATSFLQKELRFAVVFDGKPPALKRGETERRKAVKLEAAKEYERAAAAADVVLMRKYAARTSRLTSDMIDQAKKLLTFLGVPVIQAPSEGEAQASHIVKKGDGWAVASQDYDSLLFGAPRLVQNLSIAGRRKTGMVRPELIELLPNLKMLELGQDQLIALAILIGTDYNPGGVKGIGPKKALKLVHEHGKDFEAMFGSTSWKEIFDAFTNMPVTDDYVLEWKGIDEQAIVALLVDEHDFSADRVTKALAPLRKRQTGLDQFI